MKTFEERYTAWIDGQLENGALAAFEQELARRAAAGDAEADKADAFRLRTLLRDHLQAPALSNPDFFNHQLRQRIEAEAPSASRGREAGRRAKPALFAWGFAQLIGLGAFSLFTAAALYYGMMPHPGTGTDSNASRQASVAAHDGNGNAAQQVAENVVPPAANNTDARRDGSEMTLANRSPTPPPIEDIEETADIHATIPDQPVNPTTATPLHYSKPNVNVLWLNGLEYMPNVPDTSTAAPDGAAPAAPTPPASASP